MGLFLFLDPQQIKQSYLRMLVIVFPLTYVYDIFWIVQNHAKFYEDKTEGGMAQVILLLVWTLMFFKLTLFLVMWKASLNFPKFVK